MKQVYVDLDSTLNNHWVRIQKWALPSFPGSGIDSSAFSREEIMKDLPLKNSVDSIQVLSEIAEVHILTARNFPYAKEISMEWLDKFNYNYSSINTVKQSIDKPNFLSGLEVDLLIDDFSAGQEHGPSYLNLYHNTISSLKNLDIPFLIFRGDWDKTLRMSLEFLNG